MQGLAFRLATIWLSLSVGFFLAEGSFVVIGVFPQPDWWSAAKGSILVGVALFLVWLRERRLKRRGAEPTAAPGPAVEDSKDEQAS